MKTVFIVTLLSALLLTSNALAQTPISPDLYIDLAKLEGWRVIVGNSVDLKAPSGNYGTWERKVLAFEDTLRKLEINIFKGEGPGTLYVPEGDISENDRPVGSGATYETVTIRGFRGILETYPHIGKALNVRLPEDLTLCLESRTLSAEELKQAAASIIVMGISPSVSED